MGFILGVSIVAALLLLQLFFGLSSWLIVVALVAFVAGLCVCVLHGHRAFKTGTNTDLVSYVCIFMLAAAVFVPLFNHPQQDSTATTDSDEKSSKSESQ